MLQKRSALLAASLALAAAHFATGAQADGGCPLVK